MKDHLDYTDIPDIQLVDKFKKTGDKRIVAILLQRKSVLISIICNRFIRDRTTAEEIPNELFVKLCKKLPYSTIDRNFNAWLKTVLQNYLKDLLKKENNRQKAEKGYGEDRKLVDTGNRERRMDMAYWVEQIKSHVSEEEWIILECAYVQRMKAEEIAIFMGWDKKSVENRIFRIKKKLQKILGNEFPNDFFSE